jgi:acyl-CoA reductase-like NAD-dependent aldehyde dehydrogenase
MTAVQGLREAVAAPGDVRLFIDGEYVESAGERFEVVSPVTGAVIGTMPVPGAGEIDTAVAEGGGA